MPLNLRALPIEGIATDAAGNVIRNSDIVIKQECPTGTFVITTITTGGDGYFVTDPLKNGVYDIYESGVRVQRIYHSAQPTQLQLYKPISNNVPSALPTFASFISTQPAATPTPNINDFKMYLQLEPEDGLDIPEFGNMFPIWNGNPISSVDMSGHPFANMKNIHTGMSSSSRLTQTRFDVEYFQPLVRNVNTYRRVRWSGVPGIRFSNSSKIVIGLDYYGIIPKNPYFRTTTVSGMSTLVSLDSSVLGVTVDTAADSALLGAIGFGDIVRLTFSDTGNKVFWGVYYIDGTAATGKKQLMLRLWKSSNNSHVIQSVTAATDFSVKTITSISVFQGMYQGIESLNESIGERFFVVENMESQNRYEKIDAAAAVTQESEFFNYTKAV